jgi:hypothetical protein
MTTTLIRTTHEDELSAGCQTAIREAKAHHHPRSDGN